MVPMSVLGKIRHALVEQLDAASDALPPAPELRPWGAEGHRDGALAEDALEHAAGVLVARSREHQQPRMLGKILVEGLQQSLDGRHIVSGVDDDGRPLGQALDAGLIIHEGQLTYSDNDLQLIVDLGVWWKDLTGLPAGQYARGAGVDWSSDTVSVLR